MLLQLQKDGTWDDTNIHCLVDAKQVLTLCERLPYGVPIYLTIGNKLEHPNTNNKPMTPQQLINYIHDNLRTDYRYNVKRFDTYISVNAI